jgi:hypothetical protein
VRDHVTITLRGVGGQSLAFVAYRLVRRLAPFASALQLEETHGMAQRGGIVSARIEVDLVAPRRKPAPRVLLGLERIEGARGLATLVRGDAAFLSSAVLLPPGGYAADGASEAPAPPLEAIRNVASDVGVDLVIVDTTADAPWPTVEAAFARGALPSNPGKRAPRRTR